MDEIKAFRTFLLAAQKRNFAQVARELDTTPAFVTRTIAALEAQLGVQLFVRTTRRVSLTTDGALFAARIDPAMRMLVDARTDMINAHKADEGRLRLNAPMSLGQRVLPQILGSFRNLYPKIAIELSLTDRLVDMVEQDFDLAIRISGPPSDKFTIWRKICEVRRILVAAPGSTCSAAMHPNELNPDACLAYSPDSRLETWELSDGKTTVTVSAGRSVSANNGELLARMAADGAGVTLLPVFIVADHLKAGRLVPILSGWQPPQLWLTLYYPPYQKLPPRIDAFSNFVEQNIPALMTTLE
ncbi:LysR family transcriptional regulator [Pseudochelatococcus contaminans]|uniref:DNA-binding transcriptional LysR family regulator n=1 Tax=Pseudochelatococcus contaminans TaxID=1538103 RepID=A0A7W5Z4R4_9HYPH|nr:LysR family transcriptional regulator [Pseudochelatococcus contaminans]MBB3810145.1 DNA-binding transcriptional LysR family regulator [Pseudochelatococcus contaminans]